MTVAALTAGFAMAMSTTVGKDEIKHYAHWELDTFLGHNSTLCTELVSRRDRVFERLGSGRAHIRCRFQPDPPLHGRFLIATQHHWTLAILSATPTTAMLGLTVGPRSI